jgi:hypothetical protein
MYGMLVAEAGLSWEEIEKALRGLGREEISRITKDVLQPSDKGAAQEGMDVGSETRLACLHER